MIIVPSKKTTFRFAVKALSLIVIFQLVINDISFALSPAPGTQNPAIRCEYLVNNWQRSGRLIYAETDEDIRFLRTLNKADALLLSHGKVLAASELKTDPTMLLRKIAHEEIEAILQILSNEDRAKYSDIINMVLTSPAIIERYYGLFSESDRPKLKAELLANDIIARAFEILTLRVDRLIDERRITSEESAFLKVIEPIINFNKHNYFTGEFWDSRTREIRIRLAMARGIEFIQVASRDDGVRRTMGASQRRRFEPSVKGKKRTGVSRQEIFAEFKSQLRRLGPDIVDRLKSAQNMSQWRSILIENGVDLVDEIDGKFLIQAIGELRTRSKAIAVEPQPAGDANRLRFAGKGRYLKAYAGENFDHIVKVPVGDQALEAINNVWIGAGHRVAVERLNGYAAPTLIIDASDGRKRDFVYHLKGSDSKSASLAIVQPKLERLMDRIKSLARSGRVEEIKALIEQYRECVIGMYRRGVVDADYGGSLYNYGIDPKTGKVLIFDLGDLCTGSHELEAEFTDNIFSMNKYIEDDLRDISPQLADHYRLMGVFVLEDFYSDGGRSYFGVDYDKRSPEKFRMSPPLSEEDAYNLFAHNSVKPDNRYDKKPVEQNAQAPNKDAGEEDRIIADIRQILGDDSSESSVEEKELRRWSWREEEIDLGIIKKTFVPVMEAYGDYLEWRAGGRPDIKRHDSEYNAMIERYAAMDAKTAPRIVVQVDKYGRYCILDGTRRSVAAILRGDKTARAYVGTKRDSVAVVDDVVPASPASRASLKPLKYIWSRIPKASYIYKRVGEKNYDLFIAPALESAFIVLPKIFGFDLTWQAISVSMAVFTAIHIFNIDWQTFGRSPPLERLKTISRTFIAPLALSAVTAFYSYSTLKLPYLMLMNYCVHSIINGAAIATDRKYFHTASINTDMRGDAEAPERLGTAKTPSQAKGTALVTGGAGYIGSHTVRELLSQGYDVVILDSMVKGREFAIEECKTFATEFGRRLIVEKGDLGDTAFVNGVFDRNKEIDKVIHFAAFTEVPESTQRPALYYYNNIINTTHLLDAMQKHDVKRIIFSSSAAVYGTPDSVPIPEDAPARPINPYGFTKLMMEKMIRHYQERFGIEWVALRYFNASAASHDGRLGEAHHPESHVIPRIIEKFLSGSKPGIYGFDYNTRDGTCLRDYISVEDLARAHVLALEGKDEAINRPYNLGTGNGFTVKEIVEAAARILEVAFTYETGTRRPGDPDALVATSKAFANAFGWSPVASGIENVLRTAIAWYRNRPAESLEAKPLPVVDEREMASRVESELRASEVIPAELQDVIIGQLRIDMKASAAGAGKIVSAAAAKPVAQNAEIPIRKIVLNGKDATGEEVRRIVSQMASAEGEYIFNAIILDGLLKIDISRRYPEEGVRSSHILLSEFAEDMGSFSGIVDTGPGALKTVSIYGMMPDAGPDRELAGQLSRDLVRIAGFLVENGIPDASPIDETTADEYIRTSHIAGLAAHRGNGLRTLGELAGRRIQEPVLVAAAKPVEQNLERSTEPATAVSVKDFFGMLFASRRTAAGNIGLNLLDVGTNTGENPAKLKRLLESDGAFTVRSTGIDIRKRDSVGFAKHAEESERAGVRLLYETPFTEYASSFSDMPYDVITLNAPVIRIDDQFFASLDRLLTADGAMIIRIHMVTDAALYPFFINKLKADAFRNGYDVSELKEQLTDLRYGSDSFSHLGEPIIVRRKGAAADIPDTLLLPEMTVPFVTRGDWPGDEAVSILVSMLHKEDWRYRELASWELSKLGERASPQLMSIALSAREDQNARLMAIDILRMMNSDKVVETLGLRRDEVDDMTVMAEISRLLASRKADKDRMAGETAAPASIKALRPVEKIDAKCVVFDWDGTISRIREDWEGLMAPLAAAVISGVELTEAEWGEILDRAKNGEVYSGRIPRDAMQWAVDFIEDTKGDPTKSQFERIVKKAVEGGHNDFGWVFRLYEGRGETVDRSDPARYLAKFYAREELGRLRDHRLALLDVGAIKIGDLLVPGALELIRTLRAAGVRCVVVTGSESSGVKAEAEILGLQGIEVIGQDLDRGIINKRDAIRDIKEKLGLKGSELIVVGDGKVEMAAGAQLGCVTVGIVSKDNERIMDKITKYANYLIEPATFEPAEELARFFAPSLMAGAREAEKLKAEKAPAAHPGEYYTDNTGIEIGLPVTEEFLRGLKPQTVDRNGRSEITLGKIGLLYALFRPARNERFFSITNQDRGIGHGWVRYLPEKRTVLFRYSIHNMTADKDLYKYDDYSTNPRGNGFGTAAAVLMMAASLNGNFFGDIPIDAFKFSFSEHEGDDNEEIMHVLHLLGKAGFSKDGVLRLKARESRRAEKPVEQNAEAPRRVDAESVEKMVKNERGAWIAAAEDKAAVYGKSGQCIVLYADDIVENALMVDLEDAVKNILVKHNLLDGGRVMLYGRDGRNASLLEEVIKTAGPGIETLIVTRSELQAGADEISEAGAVLRFARSKPTRDGGRIKDVLALIKGPTIEPERLTDFARTEHLPVFIVGTGRAGKGEYLLSHIIAMALDAKSSNGTSRGWVMMLEPMVSLSGSIERLYEEKKLSLAARVAA